MFRRTLPWLGWGLAVTIAFAGLWLWYISAQRMRLEEQDQAELARLGRDLKTVFTDLPCSAEKFFRKPNGTPSDTPAGVDAAKEFARRNPYIRPDIPEDAGGLAGGTAGAGMVDPETLRIASLESGAVDLTVDTAAIFDDVAMSNAFEYLFIADSEGGRILFGIQDGAAARHREEIGWLQRRARSAGDRAHPTITLKYLEHAEALKMASGSGPVRLGDTTYQLFTYPFEVMTRSCEKSKGAIPNIWIVGGLVAPSKAWRESMTISPHWTLLLFLPLVLAVAGKPFVKLFFIEPSERYRFADACLLLPSATFLLMLVTVAILDLGAYKGFDSLAASGLKRLARKVEMNLTEETRQMRDQLVEFDRRLAASEGEECRVKTLRKGNNVVDLLSTPGILGPASTYRDLTQVAWLDPDGEQFFKAIVLHANTPPQRLASRSYFTEVRDGHLWSFEDGRPPGPGFFMESIRSVTTAELSTAVSIPSALTAGCKDKKEKVVAVLTGAPVWADHPFLPSGYGFAVISADGQTLYHSDRRRILKQNFFDELGDAETLHAAVLSGTAQQFTTTYSRRPTEVYVEPLASIPQARWFVVAFRDRTLADTINTETIARTILWLLLPLTAPLLTCLIGMLRGKNAVRFFWPRAERAGLYRALATLCFVLLVIGVITQGKLGAQSLFFGSLAFPWLVALVQFVMWRVNPKADQKRYREWYVAAVAGLWAASAIPSAIGLFRHSWQLEMSKLEALESARWAQHRRDWSARDDFQFTSQVKVAGGSHECYRDDRLRYLADYRSPLAKPGNGTTLYGWLQSEMDRRLPLYNEVVEKVRFEREKKGGRKPVPEESSYGLVKAEFGWPGLLAGLALFVVTAIVLWGRTGVVLRALFIQKPGVPCVRDLAAENRFAILIAREPGEKRALAAEAPQMAAVATASGSMAAPRTSETVDDFERMLCDSGRRLRGLEGLEAAVESDSGRAVIIAGADPFAYFSSRPSPDSDHPHTLTYVPPAERQRWRAVLGPFVAFAAVPASSGPPATEAQCEALWRGCSRCEKLILIQVEQEGFPNPRQTDVVKELLAKKLLHLDPHFTLGGGRWAEFVRRRASGKEIANWERPEGALGWRGIRWILMLVLIGLLVFLAGSQDSWFKSAAAMMTVVTGGLQALWELLRAVQRFHAPS